MKGDEIFRACASHSFESVTLSKYAAEYQQNAKMYDRIPQQVQGCGIKIAIVNSIRVAKPLNLFNISVPSFLWAQP